MTGRSRFEHQHTLLLLLLLVLLLLLLLLLLLFVLIQKPAMMRIVAHQTVSLYQILEMASLSDRDPISCVSGFYSV